MKNKTTITDGIEYCNTCNRCLEPDGSCECNAKEVDGMISVNKDGEICDNANNKILDVYELAEDFNLYSETNALLNMKLLKKNKELTKRLDFLEKRVCIFTSIHHTGEVILIGKGLVDLIKK